MERQVEDMWMKMTEWERIWSHWPLAVNRTLLPLSEEESRGEEMQKHKGLQLSAWKLEVFLLVSFFPVKQENENGARTWWIGDLRRLEKVWNSLKIQKTD